jgi:hypothetical protein
MEISFFISNDFSVVFVLVDIVPSLLWLLNTTFLFSPL